VRAKERELVGRVCCNKLLPASGAGTVERAPAPAERS
jgi:hypothetical protein